LGLESFTNKKSPKNSLKNPKNFPEHGWMNFGGRSPVKLLQVGLNSGLMCSRATRETL
jgi:hypothetical protein